ncbi:MAG: thiamine pyrophosphate-dependent enzyme, partial [Planctomycetaceae bacterium]|nr:thiamine pyrophosphate-dependent enzyme [Planctomycetaceae bacterium]
EWIEPNRRNMRNWKNYLAQFADRDDVPLRCEPVFKEINRIAKDDAVFITDVGNTTIHAIRLLDMNGKGQRFTTSGLFATMGYGVPGGIAAKLQFPERQIFTLSGDGAFAMVMHDVATQVRYKLPVINVVFSNDSLGFIEAEQEDTGQNLYGVDLDLIDFAKSAESMGATGFTVRKRAELASVFDAARDAETPVVIDVKVENSRPFPAEFMTLKPEIYEREDFRKRYEVGDMPTLVDLLND